MSRLDPSGRRILRIVVCLLVVGLASLFSAYVHSEGWSGDGPGQFLRQLAWVAMGLATVWAVPGIPTRRAASLSFVLYAAGLLSWRRCSWPGCGSTGRPAGSGSGP